MIEALLIISLLIWVPFIFHQMFYRGFLVLLIWLLVAPVVSNIIRAPTKNPLFPAPLALEEVDDPAPKQRRQSDGYFTQAASVTATELLEPTRLIFGVFLLLFLGRSFVLNRPVPPPDRTERWMLIFCLLVLVNVVVLSNRFAFSVRIAIDAFVVPFLAYVTARRFVADEGRLNQFVRFMAYFGCFLICICLLERFLHPVLLHRVQGPFKSRDYLYVAMMVIFFIVAVDVLLNWSKDHVRALPRWMQWSLVIGSPVIILLTLTRGNWVGFLAGLWIFALFGRSLLTRRQKLATVGLIIGLLPIVIIGAEELLETSLIGSRATKLSTIESRIRTYRIVAEEGAQNPVLGIGLNNLRNSLQRQSRFADGKILGTAHSSYLALFAELGIFGLISYLAIMSSIYRTGLRIIRTETGLRDRWRGVALVAMLTAYLVPGLFTHLVYGQIFAHIYLFACIGAIAGRYGLPHRRTVEIVTQLRRKEAMVPELVSGIR